MLTSAVRFSLGSNIVSRVVVNCLLGTIRVQSLTPFFRESRRSFLGVVCISRRGRKALAKRTTPVRLARLSLRA
jgi:hypothetical protein